MRTIITGDIHGCFDEFEELLKKVNLMPVDKLIILGDLFDRGPNSYEVFQKVLALQKEIKDFHLIKGNHEDLLVKSTHDFYTWSINGCDKTIESFKTNNDDVYNYIDYFKSLPTYYKDDKIICVHAGMGFYETVEDADDETLIWDRDCANYGIYNGPLVITGHTPVKVPYIWQDSDIKVFEYDIQYDLPDHGFMGIDTACVFGGRLTAVVIMDNKMMLRAVDSRQPKRI